MPFSSKDLQQQGLPAPASISQRLLSRDEVAAFFGIPKRFLEIAACKGGGPAFVKVGRLTRYRGEDIEAWIAKNRFSSTSEAAGNKGQAQ